MSRVVLAMSGGVDSSVAAHLLREAGHEVVGVFMRHGQTLETACALPAEGSSAAKASAPNPLQIVTPSSAHKQGCCTASDAADARRVADKLDIPFYALDFTAAFDRIIDYFVDEYSHARTPNPCVMCNNWIKFGRLFDYADSIQAEFVATGHYARLSRDASGQPQLLRGIDDDKDQSYVLFGVERHLLSRMLLPVGEFRKPEVRRLAGEVGMRVAEKKDSQEICFVAQGKQAEFVRARRSLAGNELDTSGEIVTVEGDVVGTHAGIEGYTIGQRKGLGVAFGEPRYVVRIEGDTRRVVLGQRRDLERTTLRAAGANWLVDTPAEPFSALVQIRYNSAAHAATVTPRGAREFDVVFDEPVHGVAPGQAAVVYASNRDSTAERDSANERVLGGGWIASKS
jgi:tRNA-specific 2-thiouridylase